MNIKDALKKRLQYMGKSPFFYKEPLNLETGEGVWLYDKAGKKYLDAYNNVPVVGHCHPKIVSSLKEQASKLNTHSRYLSEVVIDYSQKLTSLHPKELSTLQMACSGTEAVEIAITMARIYTGGVGIICSNATYHGNSHEISRMSVGPFEPEFRRVPYPQYFRPIQKNLTEEELCNLYLDKVRQEIKGFKEDGIKFAGLIFCSIFANEGLPDIPKKYFGGVSKIVREAGGVVIFDEVQAGFGRTGRWWGYQMTDTTPDIAVMGKPMGAGLPVSGVVARKEIAKEFHEKSQYFNTTAGTPLQAAVGTTVIEIIEEEGLIENANETGGYMKKEFLNLKDYYPSMGDVRGHGLFLGVDMIKNLDDLEPDKEGAVAVVEKMKEKGFLISYDGQFENVLKIRPPLVFKTRHAELFLTGLEETLKEVS